ncbi:hypothetical protein H072_8067 [Dactylellina haptotyla CBS 200.50]|uniref:PHD-type domain-containing protein n=1 Tax=Dactylellina haptotyla (strain CBS 200.50) TaxID=1284197 RepID=S8A609_DACHA|nr:hypothetical protein H072_8067 [Dactylellina haptotyla CBS 200.50]
MPPKKSGDSSTGGTGGNAGTKRKFQDGKARTNSRSQTPNDAVAGAAGAPFTPVNGSSESGVIAFTPMNVPKSSAAAAPARNGSRVRSAKKAAQEISGDEVDSIYDSSDEKKTGRGSGKPPKRRTQNAAMEASSNGESTKGGDASTAGQASKIPRRRKSSKFKEGGEANGKDNEAEMPDLAKDQTATEGKKKGRFSTGKDSKKDKVSTAGSSRGPTKQSTLERHFRPLSQETDPPARDTAKTRSKQDETIAEEKPEAPQGRSGIILKFKTNTASSPSTTISPSNFYGSVNAEKGDLPAPTGKLKTGKMTSNGTHKEKLVLQTNPPSSDTLSESLPSPPVTAETVETGTIMTPLDGNSGYGGRGRRTTRNAQPVYSGFPTPQTGSSVPPQPTSSNSRQTSPSYQPTQKSAKKTAHSVSPRRGGKRPAATQTSASTTPVEAIMAETAMTKTTANDRRNRIPKKTRYLDDTGRFIDVEPPKQTVSYGNPKVGPAPVEYGMLPLGTLPPKERVDEVFNKPVPKEPEPRCDMTSAYQFYNLWGTVGNKDVTTMKANQGRAKRMFQKNGKLSADNEWIFPDTEGAKIVNVVDVDDGPAPGPGPKGKSKNKRPRLSTGLGLDTSTSPSPSFMPDPQLRSTEELVSPVSENIPETPRELGDMDLDEPEVQDTRQTSEGPSVIETKLEMATSEISDLSGALHESATKPDVLAVIKRAKAMAEEAGNLDVVALLNEVETSGNTTTALDSINQILRGDMSRRLSPATIPGTKRTALQRDEDEGIMLTDSKEHPGKKRRVVEPYFPPSRPKRPDAIDEAAQKNLMKILKEGKERIARLDDQYIPTEYTCLRGEPDEENDYLHGEVEDRCFEVDEDDFNKEWSQTSAYLQRCQDFVETQKEKVRLSTNGEDRRRRNGLERSRTQEPGASDDEEMRDANENPEYLMDDEESPCTVCGGTGAPLVICDGEACHEEQHYGCAVPPLTSEEVEELPEWYCRRCSIKKKNTRKHSNPEYKGFFGQLFEVADQMNPRSFVLPKDIRESFSGVKMGKLGTYKEVIDHFNISKTKDKEHVTLCRPPFLVTAANMNDCSLRAYDHLRRLAELPFEDQLLGSDGKIAVCYHCRESRLRTDRGMLVGCDYCAQYWHQDCLPTPLVEPHAIKQRQKRPPERGDDIVLMKWKCPLHIPQEAYPVRQPCSRNEGADFEWPPKHRVSNAPAPVPEAPLENFHPKKLSGRNLLLPEKGFSLTFLPNAKKAREMKELNEQTFTGLELQGIEALRSLRDRFTAKAAPSTTAATAATAVSPSSINNTLAEFILNNIPDLYRENRVKESILNGVISSDPADQIRLITAIQKSMEAKLSNLLTRQP